MAIVESAEWITGQEAGRILGIDPDRLYRVVKAGGLHPRRIPGMHPRYLRSEVLALVETSDRAGGRDGAA